MIELLDRASIAFPDSRSGREMAKALGLREGHGGITSEKQDAASFYYALPHKSERIGSEKKDYRKHPEEIIDTA